MSDSQLLQKQDKLQAQAHEVLQDTKLLAILKEFGKPVIVGSVALGLMVWRDIDLDVEVDNKFSADDLLKIAKRAFSHGKIKDIRIIDNTTPFEKNRPKSYYLGIYYQEKGQEKWKVDIRFVKAEDSYAKDYLKEISSKLTPEKIEAILEIKQAVYQHPEYGKKFSSVDIYEAVLEKGIKSPDEFKF